MKVLTAKQMYEIDQKTIQDYRIDDLILMENAGVAITHTIIRKYPDKKSAAIIAGVGNNGGDGLVIARHLFFNKYNIVIFYAGDRSKASKNNRKNLIICRKLGIQIHYISEAGKFKKQKNLLDDYDIIIDALLGIGLKSSLRGLYADIIRHLNSMTHKIKLAVDIPTGLQADSGEVRSEVLKADITVTFGAPKICHVLSPARFYRGELIVKNIGFPEELLESSKIKINRIKKEEVRCWLPERVPYFHKNDYGHVVIFAGSIGKTGAAIMAARACLASGSGLVTVVAPEEINQILENNLIEVMTWPVDLSDAEKAFTACRSLFEKADVILAGCGITTDKKAESFLRLLLNLKNKLIILDADALNIIAGDMNMIRNSNTYILTPHIGEMSRLAQKDKNEILSNRIKIAQNFARQNNVILVLKSAETLIVSPEEEVFLCDSGNDGMASAGTGDVLAGIIAGISAQCLKQNKSLFQATAAGTFLHSLSGRFGREEKNSYSLVATDLINKLPEAINYVRTP